MIQLEVWGPYALFSRPELKVEKVSYDVPTPSAARGMVEAVYFHPGLRWRIDRIHVLNPISFTSIRRNEVLSKISARNVRQAAQGGRQELYLATPQEIVQRSSLLLQDVHYVIEAHFDMTGKASPSDNPGKFQDIQYVRNRYHVGELPCMYGQDCVKLHGGIDALPNALVTATGICDIFGAGGYQAIIAALSCSFTKTRDSKILPIGAS